MDKNMTIINDVNCIERVLTAVTTGDDKGSSKKSSDLHLQTVD